MASDRFCLVEDDDGHWYLIPWGMEDRFQKWVECEGGRIDFNQYAINCCPSRVSFENPEVL